jgi:hypothetical protein
MTLDNLQSTLPDLASDSYVVIGLSTCFIREDGEVHQVTIAEPIPSAALTALVKGVPTSYQRAIATTVAAVLEGDTPRLPETFPAETQFCDHFGDRVLAAARTYQAQPAAREIIPAGTAREDFNYSLERKRVLNSERIIKTEDNVKQHAYTHKVL